MRRQHQRVRAARPEQAHRQLRESDVGIAPHEAFGKFAAEPGTLGIGHAFTPRRVVDDGIELDGRLPTQGVLDEQIARRFEFQAIFASQQMEDHSHALGRLGLAVDSPQAVAAKIPKNAGAAGRFHPPEHRFRDGQQELTGFHRRIDHSRRRASKCQCHHVFGGERRDCWSGRVSGELLAGPPVIVQEIGFGSGRGIGQGQVHQHAQNAGHRLQPIGAVVEPQFFREFAVQEAFADRRKCPADGQIGGPALAARGAHRFLVEPVYHAIRPAKLRIRPAGVETIGWNSSGQLTPPFPCLPAACRH